MASPYRRRSTAMAPSTTSSSLCPSTCPPRPRRPLGARLHSRVATAGPPPTTTPYTTRPPGASTGFGQPAVRSSRAFRGQQEGTRGCCSVRALGAGRDGGHPVGGGPGDEGGEEGRPAPRPAGGIPEGAAVPPPRSAALRGRPEVVVLRVPECLRELHHHLRPAAPPPLPPGPNATARRRAASLPLPTLRKRPPGGCSAHLVQVTVAQLLDGKELPVRQRGVEFDVPVLEHAQGCRHDDGAAGDLLACAGRRCIGTAARSSLAGHTRRCCKQQRWTRGPMRICGRNGWAGGCAPEAVVMRTPSSPSCTEATGTPSRRSATDAASASVTEP